METITQPPSSTNTTATNRTPTLARRWLVWGVLGILLLLIGYKLVVLGRAGLAAYRAVQTLRAEAADHLTVDKLANLQAPTQDLTQALTQLQQQIAPLAPLLQRLHWLPRYGPTLAAAPELMVVGKELAALASEGLPLLQTILPPGQTDAQTVELINGLAKAQPQLATLALHAQKAEQVLAQVPIADLYPPVATRLMQVQPLLAAVGPGLQMAPSLPQLLGIKQPQTYMILVQNNHELRATGGFISAAAMITVNQAQIANLEFIDSYYLDPPDLQHPPAPRPMQRYMNVPILMLRDVNWSPDLPTTVKLFKALYGPQRSAGLHGVITVDLHSVQLLIDALGPLTLPDNPTPITGENVLEQMKVMWEQPADTTATSQSADLTEWWRKRKDFMPKLAQAVRDRLQGGDLSYLHVLQAGMQALDQRSIQVWLDDPTAATVLTKLGWDGGLHPEANADYFALVDTNMGYNKANAVVERSVHYQVVWPTEPNQPAIATATITYRHPIRTPDPVCAPVASYGKSYDDLVNRCFFNYLRLYTPVGSKLIKMEGVEPDSIASQRSEAQTQLFAGYMMVRPGEEHTVVVQYALPPTIQAAQYTLVVQRQAGTNPLPLTIEIAGQTTTTTVSSGRWHWPVEQEK